MTNVLSGLKSRAFGTTGLTSVVFASFYLGMMLPVLAQTASPAAGNTGVVELEAINVEGEKEEDPRGPVEGYVAKRSATAGKSDIPLVKTPQTVNVIPAEQIRKQGAQSVGEALRYTAGVSSEIYGTASQFDTYTQLRGFKADMFLDGLRLPDGSGSADWATAIVEPYGLERVEVLKGPSSTLYGSSGPGGLVNMVSKRPTAEPIREIQLQTGSYDRIQGAFDLSGAATEDGQFMYRLTGLVRDSDTQVDFMKDNRIFIAPAVTWAPIDDTRFTILSHYLRERDGLTSFNYLPTSGTLTDNPQGRIPRSRYAGDPDFDQFDRDQAGIGYAFEHDFSEDVTFRQNLRYTWTDVYLSALNRTNDPVDGILNRTAFKIEAGADVWTVDNQLEVHADTGPLAHIAVFGLDYRNDQTKYDSGRHPPFNPALNYPIDIYDPVYGAPIVEAQTSILKDSSLEQVGLYAHDQIEFGGGWIATLGGRFDHAEVGAVTDNLNTGIKASPSRSDGEFSGRAALGYMFESGISPYVSYSTSFQPTAETDFDGNVFEPLTAEQYEAGVKYRPAGFDALFSAAVFDITQQGTLTADPDNLFSFVQLGEVRVRGFELEARAQITDRFGVIASYAYLDSEVTESSDDNDIGDRLANTPEHQAALWADYTIHNGPFAGLGLGAGVRYIGSRYNPGNTVEVPSVTLVDAALSYDFGALSPNFEGALLSINAKNIFDEYYVSQCGGTTPVGGCTLGDGRTVLATLSYRW
jgi:iron complex outermembrane recepter protein